MLEMAGKSNRGRNRKGTNNTVNSSESLMSPLVKDDLTVPDSKKADANELPVVSEQSNANSEVKETESVESSTVPKQGEFLFSFMILFFS